MGSISRLAAVLLMALLWAPVATGQNPLAKKPEPPRPFVGEFAGKNISLDLSYEGVKSVYTGWLTFEGKRYACVASSKDGGLAGQFFVEGKAFDFSATLQGDQLTLSSGGESYPMQKQAPKNPLARAGGGMPQPQPQPQPRPAEDRPAAGETPAGGVGIAFQPNADGDLVVSAILPGSPAHKAGLKPGGVLRAVGGKDVEGMTPEQLRGLIGGKPETMVRLTIETADEVQEVLLQRADLSKLAPPQQPSQPNPAAGPQGGAAQPNQLPTPGGFGPAPLPQVGPAQQQEAPPWLKPGVRLTWWGGAATIPNAGQVLVPDDNGNWVSKDTGQKWSVSENPGSGGMGYQQLTVANVVKGMAIVDMRNYLLGADRNVSSIGASGYVTPVGKLDEYWVHPKQLAQLEAGNVGGVRILRGPYQLNGKTYNIVSITTATSTGHTNHRYDTDSGILISMGASSVGKGSWSPGGDGKTAGWVAGSTHLTQIMFMGIRETKLPWIGQRGTPQLAQLKSLEFAGTNSMAVRQAGSTTWPMSVRMDIQRIDEWSADVKSIMRVDYGQTALPNEPTVSQRQGSLASIWIDPQILARLQPGQVLDEDPITGVRTSVLGVQNGLVTFSEETRIERGLAGFDRQSGLLQSMELVQTNGIGTPTIALRRVR